MKLFEKIICKLDFSNEKYYAVRKRNTSIPSRFICE
jgi:hypothetical protein